MGALRARKANISSATPAQQLATRPPLERMQRLCSLIQSGQYPNCTFLAEQLEVSRKTVLRDVEFMRSRMGHPIEYDSRKFGYFYSGPVRSEPELEVSEGELVALLIAQMAMREHRGSAYEGPLRSACAKISAAMGEKVSVSMTDLAGRISFREHGGSEVDASVFDAVGRAVQQARELAFAYRKLGAAEDSSRKVRPYHLGCVNNQWYLFAFDLGREAMRTFALARMSHARVSKRTFPRPTHFSIEDFLGDSLGVFRGEGDLVEVRIRFSGWVAQLVRERIWHTSEKKTELAGGALELAMRLSSLEEVERWVLSFGWHAEVLEPASLRERLRQAAASILDLYGNTEV